MGRDFYNENKINIDWTLMDSLHLSQFETSPVETPNFRWSDVILMRWFLIKLRADVVSCGFIKALAPITNNASVSFK